MTHYSLSQKPEQLHKWSVSISEDIASLGDIYPVLVYTGMSGISAATAISLCLHSKGIRHGMVYVRKENEVSHGRHIERELDYAHNTSERKYIFVDDFTDQCNTINYCYNELKDYIYEFQKFEKWDYLAMQKHCYNYYDQLIKPDEHEHSYKILGSVGCIRKPSVKATVNPTKAMVWYDELAKICEVNWKDLYNTCDVNIVKGREKSSTKDALYFDKSNLDWLIEPPKEKKPKQTMPFWCKDWRK